MTLAEIADAIATRLPESGFKDRLKFDCGNDGIMLLADGQVSLEDGPAACTLKMSTANLEKLIKGKLNPMTAVMMGKIKVSGDPSVAMKLGKLMNG